MRNFFILALALVIAGCGKPAAEAGASPAQVAIEGELNEASYNQAAAKVLAEAKAANADSKLTEERLNAGIASIESILDLADQLDVDKSRLSEAELMSTLGSLLIRKAAFHGDNGRQAGAFTSKGFRYLDRAVTKYPDNVTARINRGIASAKVPEFMHKAEVAKEDLEYVSNSPVFARLTPELQAVVLSMLGEVNRRQP